MLLVRTQGEEVHFGFANISIATVMFCITSITSKTFHLQTVLPHPLITPIPDVLPIPKDTIIYTKLSAHCP